VLKDFLIWLLTLLSNRPIPTPVPPPVPIPPPPTPTPLPTDFIQQLLQLHNSRRAAVKVPIFVLNSKLTAAAQKHSNWMQANNNLSHIENGNNRVGDRVKAEGYSWSWVGENIATGGSATKVFDMWMKSPDHKANIERVNFTEVGFGVAGKYWTTVFASKSGGFMIAEICPGGVDEKA
jgi:uncharacterized protein YkwD